MNRFLDRARKPVLTMDFTKTRIIHYWQSAYNCVIYQNKAEEICNIFGWDRLFRSLLVQEKSSNKITIFWKFGKLLYLSVKLTTKKIFLSQFQHWSINSVILETKWAYIEFDRMKIKKVIQFWKKSEYSILAFQEITYKKF